MKTVEQGTEGSASDLKQIMIVDDAADTRLMVSLRLQREGYNVIACSSGPEAVDLVHRVGLPDLALLDIMMPGMDGFAVAEELRRVGFVPIVFLSALSDTETKVDGINRFAEDYITKPFVFPELLARIRRVLQRYNSSQTVEPELQIDSYLRINFAQQYAIVNHQQVILTPTENRIMRVLYSNRGRVLSPGYLLTRAWDPTRRGTVESLWVHVRRLRSKIEPDPDHPRYVVTVRGQGYCFPQRTGEEESAT